MDTKETSFLAKKWPFINKKYFWKLSIIVLAVHKYGFFGLEISSWIVAPSFQQEFGSICYRHVGKNFHLTKNSSICSDFMKRLKNGACKPNSEFGFKILTY